MSKKKDICKEVENLKVLIKLVLHDPKTSKFLLLKRKDGKKMWGFVGGTVGGDEDISNTIVRKVEEEIGDGVKYSVNGIVHAKRCAAQGGCGECIKIVYLATYEGGEISLSEEYTKYKWIDAKRVKKGKYTSWVKEVIQKVLEKIESIESVERLHRCLADFDNYKKRQVEQQKEFTKYASEGVISDMLPVLDNFHAATDHIPDGEADNPWVTGIMFIQQQMEKVFEEHDVTKIEVSVGDEFNPNIMEAVKNNDEKLDEYATVEKIAQPGYKIGEKVLRPARVVLK